MSDYLIYGPTDAAGALKEALVKEDVSDLITDLFPLDTPLHQTLEKVPMYNVFTEQPVDTHSITRTNALLAASSGGSTTLARPEGYTYTTKTPLYPAKLKSVAEIQGISFGVSDTDRAVSHYGISDRYAYEVLKTTQDVVNNKELSMWWSLGSTPAGNDIDSGGGAVLTARQTQGLVPWITFSGLQATSGSAPASSRLDGNGNDFGSASALLAPAGTTAYNANGLTLDATMFKEKVMSPWWQLTGRQAGAIGFCGPRVKSLFSEFAQTANGPINERTLSAASKMIVDTVDYYETDFGVISLNLCRYLGIPSQSTTVALTTVGNVAMAWDETLVLIKPQYWNIGVLRGVTFTPLAKLGDSEQGLVRGESALICRNPQGGTAVVNCV